MRSATCLAVLATFVVAALTVATNASQFHLVDEALVRQDFATAKLIVAGFDDDTRDFYDVYIDSIELIAKGDCASATPRLEALGVAQPGFLPAHRYLYLCDIAGNDTRSAAVRLDVILAQQPEGPARDLTLTLRRNLAYADGPVFSFYGDVIPSTNISRQTSSSDLNGWTIPEANRATKGVRVRGGTNITFGVFHSGTWTTTGVVSGSLETDTVSNEVTPRFSFELPTTLQRGNALFGTGPRLGLKFQQGHLVETQIGGKAFASWQIGPRTTLRVDAEIYRSEHKTDTHLNATHFSSAVAHTYALLPNLSMTTRVEGVLDLYDREHLRRHTIEVGASLDYTAPNGLLLGTGLTLGGRWHNQPPPMRTATNQIDTFVSVSGAIGHSAFTIGPITPMVQYSYTKQWSDSVFYQYESHDVGIKLRASL